MCHCYDESRYAVTQKNTFSQQLQKKIHNLMKKMHMGPVHPALKLHIQILSFIAMICSHIFLLCDSTARLICEWRTTLCRSILESGCFGDTAVSQLTNLFHMRSKLPFLNKMEMIHNTCEIYEWYIHIRIESENFFVIQDIQCSKSFNGTLWKHRLDFNEKEKDHAGYP